MPSGLRTLLLTLGTVLFAIMTMAMLILGLFYSPIASVLLALVFGTLTVFFGYLSIQDFRQRQSGSVPSGLGQQHSRLLKLAAHQNGRLTAEEAAIECRISIEQAEALLEDLVNKGRADTWVSDSGALVYVFQGLLEDEKASAEDPMKFLDP